MKLGKLFSLLLILLLVLSGCNNDNAYDSSTPKSTPDTITAYGRSISAEEINAEIMTAFNNVLYYQENEAFSNSLNIQIEYELFYDPNHGYPGPEVYFIIVNLEHPLSTVESPKLYKLGITVSEKGLQTYFYENSYVSPSEDISAYLVEGGTYLGHHTALINNISAPVHEEMSEQWKLRAEEKLQRYMDKNDFYSDDQKNLPEGNYDVYIKGFSEKDTDSVVVFVHEDGRVYEGVCYFVHEMSEGGTASLNHVALVDNVDASYMEYLEKIKGNAAFYMEYMVDSSTGDGSHVPSAEPQ